MRFTLLIKSIASEFWENVNAQENSNKTFYGMACAHIRNEFNASDELNNKKC